MFSFLLQKPKLLGKASNPLLDFLQQRCPITSREYYRPTFWCYGSRLQTGLRVAVFRDAPQVDYRMYDLFILLFSLLSHRVLSRRCGNRKE